MLDTNIFLFMVNKSRRLSKPVESIVTDWSNSLCMSMESVREIIIKQRDKDFNGRRWNTIESLIGCIQDEFMIDILPIDLNVMRTLFALRPGPDHHDPFDHIIIAQAITCRMPLISADEKFPYYCQQGLRLVENRG
jgi:PIN domain nuclease of toxin-antitoxin system